jgi:hypothetical protein
MANFSTEFLETKATPAADPAYNPADPATRQTPVDNPPDGKPMMVTYRPALGEPNTVEAYGTTLKAGEAVEIDPKFRDKVAGNPHFSIDGQKTYGDDKREPVVEEEDEPLTFEEAVVASRMEEYGTSDPLVADDMRRTGETSFDRPLPRRRGRPPKDVVREEAKARAEDHEADLGEAKAEGDADQAEEERRRDEIERAQLEQRANRGVTK